MQPKRKAQCPQCLITYQTFESTWLSRFKWTSHKLKWHIHIVKYLYSNLSESGSWEGKHGFKHIMKKQLSVTFSMWNKRQHATHLHQAIECFYSQTRTTNQFNQLREHYVFTGYASEILRRCKTSDTTQTGKSWDNVCGTLKFSHLFEKRCFWMFVSYMLKKWKMFQRYLFCTKLSLLPPEDITCLKYFYTPHYYHWIPRTTQFICYSPEFQKCIFIKWNKVNLRLSAFDFLI